jgi:hypothetical protein
MIFAAGRRDRPNIPVLFRPAHAADFIPALACEHEQSDDPAEVIIAESAPDRAQLIPAQHSISRRGFLRRVCALHGIARKLIAFGNGKVEQRREIGASTGCGDVAAGGSDLRNPCGNVPSANVKDAPRMQRRPAIEQVVPRFIVAVGPLTLHSMGEVSVDDNAERVALRSGFGFTRINASCD